MNIDQNLSVYFRGEKLYGDDFDLSKIQTWFDDEKEGYAGLSVFDRKTYKYGYYALNYYYGFKHLPSRKYDTVLGIGSAFGHELKPILESANKIVVMEPSDSFTNEDIDGVPVEYIKPSIDGLMDFKDDTFDLITCFGVLHHIPNVSVVLKEMHRCLKSGGYVLLREPTVSMGDWRTTRRGATKNERGIPLDILNQKLDSIGFKVINYKRCMVGVTSKLRFLIKEPIYNLLPIVYFDRFLSLLFSYNKKYHTTNPLYKFRPSSAFYVLTKA